MDWIIQSRGEITRGISESPHYTTEDGFRAASSVTVAVPTSGTALWALLSKSPVI
jgi:hypothetical protein